MRSDLNLFLWLKGKPVNRAEEISCVNGTLTTETMQGYRATDLHQARVSGSIFRFRFIRMADRILYIFQFTIQ